MGESDGSRLPHTDPNLRQQQARCVKQKPEAIRLRGIVVANQAYALYATPDRASRMIRRLRAHNRDHDQEIAMLADLLPSGL